MFVFCFLSALATELIMQKFLNVCVLTEPLFFLLNLLNPFRFRHTNWKIVLYHISLLEQNKNLKKISHDSTKESTFRNKGLFTNYVIQKYGQTPPCPCLTDLVLNFSIHSTLKIVVDSLNFSGALNMIKLI